MIKVLKKGMGINYTCYYWDLEHLKNTDPEYDYNYKNSHYMQYIICPVCKNKAFVREGNHWINGAAPAYEKYPDKEEEV